MKHLLLVLFILFSLNIFCQERIVNGIEIPKTVTIYNYFTYEYETVEIDTTRLTEYANYLCPRMLNPDLVLYDERIGKRYLLEKKLLHLAIGLDYENVDPELQKQKVHRFWSAYYLLIRCDNTCQNYKVRNGLLLYTACTYKEAEWFYDTFAKKYRLPLLVPDEKGQTIIDWLDENIELEKSLIDHPIDGPVAKIRIPIYQYHVKKLKEYQKWFNDLKKQEQLNE